MRNADRTTRGERGFTLIELMIVVVIIGILAAVAVPKFNQVSKAAKESEAEPILKQLYTLQERHKQAKDVFATRIDDLEGDFSSFQAKYYVFELTADPEGGAYLACARPTLDGLSYLTINSDREIIRRPGSCN